MNLNLELFEMTSKLLLSSPEFNEKLIWWLQGGHSTERWISFEWAYNLQKIIGKNDVVQCEYKWVDVVVFPASKGKDSDSNYPVAGFEIKWWGNWAIREEDYYQFGVDIKKIKKYNFPSAAVLLYLKIDDIPNSGLHDWLKERITAQHDFHLQNELSFKFNRKPNFSISHGLEHNSNNIIGTLETHVYLNT